LFYEILPVAPFVAPSCLLVWGQVILFTLLYHSEDFQEFKNSFLINPTIPSSELKPSKDRTYTGENQKLVIG